MPKRHQKPAPAAPPGTPGGLVAGPAAVIDLGSSALRLLLAEWRDGGWHILEAAEKPVPLGRDVFATGRISAPSINLTLRILEGFRELMAPYRVQTVKAFATSALREASNRDTFIDRLRRRTGIEIEVIAGVQANYYTYLGVRHALRDCRPSLSRINAVIMEVGGGSTDVMLLERGKMAASHTLHVGTVRAVAGLHGQHRGEPLERLQREDIRSTLNLLTLEMPLDRIGHFIAVGGDARTAARLVGHEASPGVMTIERQAFRTLIERLHHLGINEVVSEFGLPYNDAESLLPALVVYDSFLDTTGAERMIVPFVSIRDGVLQALAEGGREAMRREFRAQIVASARSLGDKYHYDARHAQQVCELSLQLFDGLRDEHGMDDQDRLLLEVAALVHDIGAYVNTSAHHKHGQYLVENADLFGLEPDDIKVIGNVIRYHRKSVPKDTHPAFTNLPTAQRNLILKLAALLRVADAMDRGHLQRIRQPTLVKNESELKLLSNAQADITLEQLSVTGKGDLFEEVFGMRVMLL